MNAYILHDVSEWRDLNSKFVLQCYRDYIMFDDKKYLVDMFPQVGSYSNFNTFILIEMHFSITSLYAYFYYICITYRKTDNLYFVLYFIRFILFQL